MKLAVISEGWERADAIRRALRRRPRSHGLIARRFGVSKQYVSKLACQMGVGRNQEPLEEADTSAILADLEQAKLSKAEIARKHGVSKPYVGKLAQQHNRHGRPLPPKKEPPVRAKIGTPEHSAMMSKIHSDQWQDPTYRDKMLATRRSPEYRDAMSQSQTGVWDGRGGFWAWVVQQDQAKQKRTLYGMAKALAARDNAPPGEVYAKLIAHLNKLTTLGGGGA